jgi:FAD/FMN-containing dehydrogenase
MNRATTAAVQLGTLRARIAGDVIGRRDDGFDSARQAFMLTADQRPAIVALPESAQDVLEIVRPAHSDGKLLADAPVGAIDAVVRVAGPGSGAPLLSVELRHLGAALARATAGGPQATLAGGYAAGAVGLGPTPEIDEAVGAQVRRVKDALGPWRAEYDFFNFRDSPADGDAVLPRDAYDRLRQIKAHYDPTESIISAHPIRPAA